MRPEWPQPEEYTGIILQVHAVHTEVPQACQVDFFSLHITYPLAGHFFELCTLPGGALVEEAIRTPVGVRARGPVPVIFLHWHGLRVQ